jgi:hypothetical protein
VSYTDVIPSRRDAGSVLDKTRHIMPVWWHMTESSHPSLTDPEENRDGSADGGADVDLTMPDSSADQEVAMPNNPHESTAPTNTNGNDGVRPLPEVSAFDELSIIYQDSERTYYIVPGGPALIDAAKLRKPR